MRILFATSIRTWGGGEEWMLGSAAGLARRGHEVTLACPGGSAIARRARAAALAVVRCPFASDADAVSFARVYRHCRERRVEVTCLNMDRVLRVGGTAAKLAGVPVILPRRGSEFALKPGALYRLTYRGVATGVIVNSRATAETLCRGIDWRPAGEVHVLPNGVDLARIEAARPREETRRALGIDADAPVLLTVGELTRRKNAMLLVDRVPLLAARFPGLVVLLAGAGREEAALRARAAALGVTGAVRLLGFREDVPDLLAASDVLVHPSRVEGFGYAVAEAMAAGLPVVATRASSLPEIVDDGVTGLLFAPEDGDALERAVAAYVADPALRARHGTSGRMRARAEFSSERRLVELEALFARELAKAPARTPVTA
jgi:glycosyltransferase involved in cell wall biosynthesis